MKIFYLKKQQQLVLRSLSKIDLGTIGRRISLCAMLVFLMTNLDAQCSFETMTSDPIECESSLGWAGVKKTLPYPSLSAPPCLSIYDYRWSEADDAANIITHGPILLFQQAGDYMVEIFRFTLSGPVFTERIYVEIEENCKDDCMFVNNPPVYTTCPEMDGYASVNLIENEAGDYLSGLVDCDGDYMYFWEDESDPGVTISNEPLLENLGPGNYHVTVCDYYSLPPTGMVSNGLAFQLPECSVIYTGVSMVLDGCVFKLAGELDDDSGEPFGIIDPCSCNNDQTANGAGDGTFSEIVEVSGPPNVNLVIGIDAINLTPSNGLYNVADVEYPLYSSLTETAPGVYQIQGYHFDDVGYTVYIMIDQGGGVYDPAMDVTGAQLAVSNVCAYPELDEPILDFVDICFNADPVDLTNNVTEVDGNPGTFTAHIGSTANPAVTEFDPTANASGDYDIYWVFNGDFVDEEGGTTANPAYPGCETVVVQTITVGGGVDFSCNNHVNVTVAASCDIVLQPAMFISNNVNQDLYELSFAEEDDTPIDEADLLNWIGQRIKVITTDICTGLSCWGWLTLEDKTAPSFPECNDQTGFLPDTTITCEEFIGGLNPLFPVVLGAPCDSQLDSIIHSDTLGMACPRGFSSVIRRLYIVTDAYGNQASCFQNINVLKKNIIEIDFPADTVVKQSVSLTCDIFDEAYQTPEYLGEPTCLDCPNIQHHYSDTHVPLECSTNKKFLRNWLIVDWCTGDTREEGQLIEILDDLPPIKICPPDTIKFTATGGDCFAAPVLDPFGIADGFGEAMFDDCSSPITIEVAYLPAIPGTMIPQQGPYIVVATVSEDNATTVQMPELALGFSWMRYRFTDACGNSFPATVPGGSGTDDASSCFFEVEIVDGNPPTAWCEGFDIVVLDQDGEAIVFAESVDDHSEDPCGQDISFEIRRVDSTCPDNASDSEFGPSITMCCNDLGSKVAVELKVTDEDGNTSTCISQLTATYDPGPLVINCPDNIVISCNDDYRDSNTTGVPTVGNVGIDPECFNANLNIVNELFDTSDLNDCGVGTVIRSFDVADGLGNILKSCIQTITLEDDGGLQESEITWPAAELTVDACGYDSSTNPTTLDSKPKVNSAAQCISIAITHDDGPIMIPGAGSGYCSSFYRTWTVTDWCTHNSANPDGINFTFEQHIYINDTSKPEFISTCEDKSVTASDHDCEAFVPLIVFVEDECDNFSDLLISWSIDVDDDGDDSNDISGNGPDASDVYPAGTHKITFVALDGCGNYSDVCMYRFTVIGDQNPTPICYADIIWSMDLDGETEVWASDFDIKSTNGCGSDNELIFSFTADGLTPALTFTCDDIPNNIGVSIPLEVYVIDAATGIYESCVVVLELQDNKDACPDNPSSMTRVSGKVMSPEREGVNEFEVMLENMSDYSMNMEMTDDSGNYAFTAVEYYNQYKVEPTNNTNPLNGVSTLDLVYIQKHILGLIELQDAYKLIAADVNDSGEVSSIDLIELRKLILGIYADYPNNDSWVFVPEAHEFADATQPFDYPRGVYLDHMYTTEEDVDFVAVKVGDVNSSVSYLTDGTEVTGRSSDLQLVLLESKASLGSKKIFELTVNEDIDLMGMQFTFEYDASELSYQGYGSGRLELADHNFGLVEQGDGYISFSYDNVSTDALSIGDVLMTLAFDQIRDGKDYGFGLTSAITTAEAYSATSEIKGIELIIGTDKQTTNEFELYQNQPNPFGEETTIAFYTPRDGMVKLEVMDANGKLLYKASDDFGVGYNSFKVNIRDLDVSGVLIYRVQTDNASVTKKMIVVK